MHVDLAFVDLYKCLKPITHYHFACVFVTFFSLNHVHYIMLVRIKFGDVSYVSEDKLFASPSRFPCSGTFVIKRSDITKPSYNKVILVVPALYISLFFYPGIMRNLI